ncbi:S-layer homology domain-containing protein [Fusibacter ferrireducens]|uniref:S-layer homology domain-containing protein n=1 Tax=Fusibacter ferrireducens TaxID=2785058 RepID=A0ABR9ZXD3_9FIRM|nr:S-layer homology domain-containing protein [Fusibacter ferrireducens]MBF4695124.1 S-layer homology domain-containing protein [Fusibacter ferrireducens]
MKRLLSLTLILCMMFSIMIPGAAFAAGTESDVTTKALEIYAKLTPTEIADRTAAYNAIVGGTANLDDAAWDLTTMEIENPYYDANYLDLFKDIFPNVKEFVTAVARIQYSYDQTTLDASIANFKTVAAKPSSVMKIVYGGAQYSITNDQLIDLFLGTYQNMSSYVTLQDANALSSAGDVDAFIKAAEGIKVKVYDGVTGATGIRDSLVHFGWNAETVKLADQDMRKALNTVQSGLGNNADIALANAAIRVNTVLKGSTSLTVGSTQSYVVSIFGQDTNLFQITVENPAIVGVNGATLTAKAVGTSKVYLHRAGVDSPVADKDYFHTFTVTVSAKADDNDNDGPSGGGPSGGGTTTPPTTPPVTDPTETNTQTENIAKESENVATEEQAGKVLEDVTKNVTDISKAITTESTTATKQVVVDSVSNLSKAIVNSTKAVTTQEGATKVVNATTTLLTETAKVAGNITDAAQLKSVVDSTTKLVSNANAVMSKVTDSAVATSLANDIIKSAATVVKAANASTTGATKAAVLQNVKKVEAQISAMAKTAIAVAGTTNMTASDVKVNSATGVGSVSVKAGDLAAKAQAAVQTQKTMMDSIKAAGLQTTKNIKPQVVINVPVVEGVKTVEASLDGLSDVFAVVDEVKISTPTASFEIDKNSFAQDLTNTVKVSAENVSVTDLTAAQRAQVPSNAKVVDLNASVGTEKVSTFKTPVTVSLPYELSANENPEKLSVYLLKDDGTVEAVPAKYVDGKVVFKRKGFSFYVVKESSVTFADLNQAAWSKDTVEYLASKGIAIAKSGNNFEPNAKITRAEFLDMLMRIAQLNGDVQKMPFTDVSADAWYAGSVAAAYENGIVSGTTATTFSPDAPITRQDMAVMISKVLMADGYTSADLTELARFNDGNAVETYAKAAVAMVSRETIVNGTPEGNFNPANNTTRAEAAAMIYNMFTK